MPLAAAATETQAPKTKSSGKRRGATATAKAAPVAAVAAVQPSAPVAGSTLPPFAADEIEDLMDEVGDIDSATPQRVAERPPVKGPVPSEIEVSAPDDDFDLDLDIDDADAPAPAVAAAPAAPAPSVARAASEVGEADVVLSRVADDSALFRDPSLEIARLAAGDGREIVVPVEIGSGSDVRRFKLSLRLTLTPVD
jgi:hypothetical protein